MSGAHTPGSSRGGAFRTAWTAAALAVAACGGSGPTGVPLVVEVVGDYAVVHEFISLNTTLATCVGDLVVASQSGGAFSGTLTIGAECAGGAGSGPVTGTVAGTSVSFTVQGLGVEELFALIGCELVSSTGFGGTATATGIQATNTQTYRCTDPDTGQVGNLPVVWRVTAERATA